MKRDELVEKMARTIVSKLPSFKCLPGEVIEDVASAALAVAVEQFFKPISNEECRHYGEVADDTVEGSPYIFNAGDFDGLLAARCSFYLNPPRSPEERVIVIPSVNDGYAVHLDHRQVFWQHAEKDAQIYRLGLIQQLKGSAA